MACNRDNSCVASLPRRLGWCGRSRPFFGVVALLAILMVPMAHGFQLRPMTQTMDAAGEPPRTTFQVRNTTDAPIAVQMRVTSRRIDSSGTEYNDDASEELQIFPSQLILRPGQIQTVRVRWTGAPVTSEERAFRVVAEQLPVNLDGDNQESTGISMMLRYRAALYVRPPEATADVTVTELDVQEEVVRVRVENRGTAHQLLAEGSLLVQSGEQQRRLDAREIDAVATVNLLPGNERWISIPREVFPAAPDEISFVFRE
ncbi:MAG: fimbria/pilus periplasmic chaperone [Alkalispirochaeta sp.]